MYSNLRNINLKKYFYYYHISPWNIRLRFCLGFLILKTKIALAFLEKDALTTPFYIK